MIKDIDSKKEILKFGVRIVDHWYIHNHDSNVYFEIILIDQKVNNNKIMFYPFLFIKLFIYKFLGYPISFIKGTRYII